MNNTNTPVLTSAQLRDVTAQMVHAVRGIESASIDNVTAKEFFLLYGIKPTQGQRIRAGQVAATFSLAAGRPQLFAVNPKYPNQQGVRLHALDSMKRAAEHLGLLA